jgi:hypothetical protein
MELEPLSKLYEATPIGGDTWLTYDGSSPLLDFQLVIAAAEAWEAVRHIEILEIRGDRRDRRLIRAVRFRRLR